MRWTTKERTVFIAAASLAVVSAMIYCSWPLGILLNPLASRTGLASELGAVGQPYNWIFIGGDIVSGALLVISVYLLMRLYKPTGWPRAALILLAIYGICGAFDAALPMQCLPSEQVCGSIWSDPLLIVHGIFDLTGSTALIGTLIALSIHGKNHARHWKAWIYTIGIGGTLFFIMSGIFYIWGGPGYWAQRYYLTLSCLWVASIPFVLAHKRAMIKVLNQ
jgi:hypothetical protein